MIHHLANLLHSDVAPGPWCPCGALVASRNSTMRNYYEIRLKTRLFFQIVPSTYAVGIAGLRYHEADRLLPCCDGFRWESVWLGTTWKSNVPWTREILRRPGRRRSRWRSTGRVSTSSWRSTTCWTWQWFVPIWHTGSDHSVHVVVGLVLIGICL